MNTDIVIMIVVILMMVHVQRINVAVKKVIVVPLQLIVLFIKDDKLFKAIVIIGNVVKDTVHSHKVNVVVKRVIVEQHLIIVLFQKGVNPNLVNVLNNK